MRLVSEHSESAVQVVALVTEGAQRPELPAPADLPGTGTFAGYSEYIMLMEQCWDQDPAARPTFAQVCIPAPTLRLLMYGSLLAHSASHAYADACVFVVLALVLMGSASCL